ncbi:hypothetical protein ACWDSJ_26190 [Nocardia sp. NPDC003482]
MTDPDPPSDPVRDWQTELLTHIAFLTREHDRVERLGPDDHDTQADWTRTLDNLTASRERAEEVALSAGVSEDDITRARAGAAALTTRPAEAGPGDDRQLYSDMLISESWLLERMALLDATRQARLHTGNYTFAADPAAQAQMERAMTIAHARVVVLANAARLSAEGAKTLWSGPQAVQLRNTSITVLRERDDLAVEHEWRQYAQLDHVPALPALLTPHASAGRAEVPLPTLAAIRAAAHAALGPDSQPSATSEATRTAIDTALPQSGIRTWQMPDSPDPHPPNGAPDLGPHL